MDSFSNALRQAIYLLDCPLQVIADSASITRHAVYDAMRGAVRMRKKTARMLAISVCNLLHEQIDRREREIANLRQRELDLRRAYNAEFGGETDAR